MNGHSLPSENERRSAKDKSGCTAPHILHAALKSSNSPHCEMAGFQQITGHDPDVESLSEKGENRVSIEDQPDDDYNWGYKSRQTDRDSEHSTPRHTSDIQA